MRALPLLLVLTLLPLTAQANHGDGAFAACDQDDDLYNHCHVGPVHWVTGPGCVAVRLYDHASCFDLRHLLA